VHPLNIILLYTNVQVLEKLFFTVSCCPPAAASDDEFMLKNTFKQFSIKNSIPSTFSIHSCGIPGMPNLAPRQAPIKIDLEQASPVKKMKKQLFTKM
jgi:hypothetical protein